MTTDTIVALASPSGRGGVAVIRVSGPLVPEIMPPLLKKNIAPRYAHYGAFWDSQDQLIDQGIALFFPAPNSYTGEDVLECQIHGGPAVVDRLIACCLEYGATMARAGAFTERAFLNGKLDLVQAEAVADLINAQSEQAARAATRSLTGAFSQRVRALVERLIEIRAHVEASMDFPDEEIDVLHEYQVEERLQQVSMSLQQLLQDTQVGVTYQEGIRVVLCGVPNAGKSSLMNALCGEEVAIVTATPGTTRDPLKHTLNLDGIPVQLIDTAGLRSDAGEVEQIGIERAKKAMEDANRVLLLTEEPVSDTLSWEALWPEDVPCQNRNNVTVVANKVDLHAMSAGHTLLHGQHLVRISAKHHLGLDDLRKHLREMAVGEASSEAPFMARRRHLNALEQASTQLQQSLTKLKEHAGAELLADDLRDVQHSLGEITGEFHADDLLGRIFSSFCIGK